MLWRMALGQALWQIGSETAAMECAPMVFSGAGVNKDTHVLLEISRPAEALMLRVYQERRRL